MSVQFCNNIRTQPAESADNVLIGRVVAGDQTAFDALVLRYHESLFNFIYRNLRDREQARDVLQYVFLQLYIFMPKLNMNLSRLKTQSKAPLKAWLFQVASNRCIDELRKHRPVLFCEMEPLDEEDDQHASYVIPDTCPLPDEVAEYHDLQYTLRHAILSLPPKFRSVVFLRYTTEMSFGEIGRVLNIPENTAKTYFQRARPLLRAALSA